MTLLQQSHVPLPTDTGVVDRPTFSMPTYDKVNMADLGLVQAFLRGTITGVQRLDDGPVLYHHFLERPYEPVTIKLRPCTMTGEPIETHCTHIKRVALLDKNQMEVQTESSADVMRVPQSLFEKVFDKGSINVIARFDHNKEKQDLVVKLGGDCFFIRVDVESPVYGCTSYTTPKIFFRTKYGPARKRSVDMTGTKMPDSKKIRPSPQEQRLEKTIQPFFDALNRIVSERLARIEAKVDELANRLAGCDPKFDNSHSLGHGFPGSEFSMSDHMSSMMSEEHHVGHMPPSQPHHMMSETSMTG
eukprot:GILK01004616.1.p1 GENE.GILK01004616.1~~GILK01004616.1.p1  ORF type:complete len:302 (+),score=39.52 GILK01004616.1:355-1260(+)